MSKGNGNIDMHCKLLLYLDGRRYLDSMRDVCEEFLENLNEKTIHTFPPLRFLLEIDVMDLLDSLPPLGYLLIKEPLKWQYMCNDIFYACFKSMETEIVQKVKPSQVAVILRLKVVPQYKSYIQNSSSLVCVTGLLISVSKLSSYIYHSVWSCPEECEDSEVILNCIPKFPPKCFICKSVLYENNGFRRCGEQVQVTFKVNRQLLCQRFNIIDDLIPVLSVGKCYAIAAVVIRTTVLVWGLEETRMLLAPITSPIPPTIKEHYDACDKLPWKFIYCLASYIGAKICPLNCFMHVKINLLLSLASVKANILTGSTILHFLAAGYDTGYVGNIMKQAAKLSDRHILLGNSVCSASTSLIASSGGVLVMPLPIHVYKQKISNDVLSFMETGDICASNTKLRCAVWAQGMDFKKTALHNIASIFGYVTRGDYGEYSDELGDFILEQSLEPGRINQEEINVLKDVVTYIDLVAGLDVSLDKTSEELLKSYFLAARKERPKSVMFGSMKVLVLICLTSARLCYRSVTNTEDAVFAIWLHVSGIPEPRFAPGEYLECPSDIKKLHVIMSNFKGWLEQFTGVPIT